MPHLVDDTPTAGHDHVMGPPPLLSRISEKLIEVISVLAHLSWLILIGVIITNVVLRYVFTSSSVALEEWQWHLYAFAFMVGLSYCLVQDQHVRVDVIAEHWSVKRRAWIDLMAMVILVMPFAYIVAEGAIPFVEFSVKMHETSRSPGGLSHRWILKSVIPFSMGLLFLAAFARALRMLMLIFKL